MKRTEVKAVARKKKAENIEVGIRLREIRDSLGYSQEKFAEILSIGTVQYQKLEQGASGLDVGKIKALYGELHVDPTYLLTGEGRPEFDLDIFLANCSREEKRRFFSRAVRYMEIELNRKLENE